MFDDVLRVSLLTSNMLITPYTQRQNLKPECRGLEHETEQLQELPNNASDDKMTKGVLLAVCLQLPKIGDRQVRPTWAH